MTSDDGTPRRPAASLPASYFDTIYERDPDPQRFRTSAYERAKYDATLAAARAACADKPNVAFALLRAPHEWPGGDAAFDLIMLSEVVYYLDRADVSRLADRVRASLAPGGDCLLVRWTGETDHPLSGDEAAERFIAATSPSPPSPGRNDPNATASTCCGRRPRPVQGQQERRRSRGNGRDAPDAAQASTGCDRFGDHHGGAPNAGTACEVPRVPRQAPRLPAPCPARAKRRSHHFGKAFSRPLLRRHARG